VTYSLASIYLQLLHPGVLQYRKACEGAGVEDPVKVLDKAGITSFFLDAPSDGGVDGAEGEGTATPAKLDGDDMDMSDEEAKEREQQKEASSREEKNRRRSGSDSRHNKDKDRRRSKSKTPSKSDKKLVAAKQSTPITNEQLVANLSTIVDKRNKSEGKEAASGDGGASASAAGDDSVKESDGTPADITPATTPLPFDGEHDAESEKERELLLSWLSPAGFEVNSPEVAAAIEADRDATRRITALEIPVGDSASILRAGAGGKGSADANSAAANASGGGGGTTPGSVKKRDFARVLEIYQEVVQAEEKAKRASSSGSKRPAPPGGPSSSSKSVRGAGSGAAAAVGASVAKIDGNPIIVVPNAMTSCITMVNAGFFLGKEATFIPRDQAVKRPDAGKRGGTISITRKLTSRLGGGDITFDIIDNPTTRLQKEDWNRVVAVIAQGASWQFKGWRYSEPVDLFSRAFGFYVGLEGAAVPNELKGWNCKIGKVSRDRRGLDNICLASFWNGLDEFMAVHKQGYSRM
jgi:parafibromin